MAKPVKKSNITKTDVLYKIKELVGEYNMKNPSGFPPILYTDKKFQDAFAKAVADFGTNGNQVHKELVGVGFEITYKTIQVYLRRLFGHYGGRGRPSKYMGDGDQRKMK